jgi:hypothetical protein
MPRGRELATLEDAGTYITRLPKAEHEAPEWQAAMEALILVATRGGQQCLRASECCEMFSGFDGTTNAVRAGKLFVAALCLRRLGLGTSPRGLRHLRGYC